MFCSRSPKPFRMKKNVVLLIVVIVTAISWDVHAQTTVRQKDKWGDKLYYVDGRTLRQKDQWGTKLFYFDGTTIRLKDQWGEKLL